ncbi:3-hydroxybutyrate dehydrogenase [Domibacillus indicus]|uniref:3-hydroxybutyrate dehydrogenase n=1 Tax=Domibacillus indicus TaxID=1437523 RepID=UPI00204125D6|nr:3-hydroxybutyrate dehydrogenase [Domibacillus indicus]MCM3787791.1 3-hydroxybutyrate dehydrogenase [Domibacillus indicus]
MLKNRTALITGAGSGIGLELAGVFAAEGANVIVADINEEAAVQAAEAFQERGFHASAVLCDVTNEEQVKSSIEFAANRYGTLDILINNAGMQHVAPIEHFSTERFNQLLSIMLTAPFTAIKHALPIMKKQGNGRIINMSSINGLVGFAGKAGYNSAKHGVIGLTKVAALEAAPHGITVNALCPGYVDTPLVRGQFEDLAKTRSVPLERVLEEVIYPLVPQKRLLEVREIADYAVFLCSDRAKGVTGQAIVLDGGYTAQ